MKTSKLRIMDGKKGCKKEKRLRRRERRAFLYARASPLRFFARFGTTRASALCVGLSQQEHAHLVFDSQPGIWEHRKKWSLTSWATDEAVDVNSLALFGLQYQQHFTILSDD